MRTERNGTTDYTQDIFENSNGSQSSKGASARFGSKEDAQASTSVVARKSTERANIGFQISFKVPITGRYPITPNTPC